MKKFVLALSLLCLLAMSVTAGPLIVKSGTGSYGTQYNTGVNGTNLTDGTSPGSGGANVTLNPVHSGWSPAPGGSEWISWINDFSPTPNGQNTCEIGSTPTLNGTAKICNGQYVTFYHEFSLSGSSFAGSKLEVLADDTAGVWLNGASLFTAAPPFPTDPYTTCAGQPIGCIAPQNLGVSTNVFSNALQAGNNVLVFQVWQRNGTGFGLSYSASIVPEPGFYGALALGLSGLYLAVRRRRQNN